MGFHYHFSTFHFTLFKFKPCIVQPAQKHSCRYKQVCTVNMSLQTHFREAFAVCVFALCVSSAPSTGWVLNQETAASKNLVSHGSDNQSVSAGVTTPHVQADLGYLGAQTGSMSTQDCANILAIGAFEKKKHFANSSGKNKVWSEYF